MSNKARAISFLMAIYIIIFLFPFLKEDEATLFDFAKYQWSVKTIGLDSGINLIFLSPFILLVIVTFLFIVYLIDLQYKQLNRTLTWTKFFVVSVFITFIIGLIFESQSFRFIYYVELVMVIMFGGTIVELQTSNEKKVSNNLDTNKSGDMI